MFRLAQVTDPHFRASSMAGIKWRSLLGKRAMGGLNLLLVRRRKHRMELLEELAQQLKRTPFDHLAITGDLGNIGVVPEWLAAQRWIHALEEPAEQVTVIPGNHDTYVADVVARRDFERVFAANQTAELRAGDGHEAHYPFVRLRGEVALVGVNSCVATGDMNAWGMVGHGQLARLESLLQHDEVRRRLRVVLMHHPPVVHRLPEHRNLRDRAAFAAVLGRVGAELVVHGHDHRDLQTGIEGPGGVRIPVVGAGSASYRGTVVSGARYNVYEIEGRQITSITYAYDPATSAYREFKRAPA